MGRGEEDTDDEPEVISPFWAPWNAMQIQTPPPTSVRARLHAQRSLRLLVLTTLLVASPIVAQRLAPRPRLEVVNRTVCVTGRRTRCWSSGEPIAVERAPRWMNRGDEPDSYCACRDGLLACDPAPPHTTNLTCDRHTTVLAYGSLVCAAQARGFWCVGRDSSVAVRVPGSPEFVVQAATLNLNHRSSLCVLSNRGEVFCGDASGVAPMPDFPRAAALAGGLRHLCILTPEGAVMCRGDNQLGQLAQHLSVASSDAFVRVQVPRASALVAGATFTCALSQGRVFCWGSIGCEPLAETSCYAPRSSPFPNPRTRTPVRMQMPGRVTALAAHGTYGCGLTTANRVACWGCGLGERQGEVVQMPGQ